MFEYRTIIQKVVWILRGHDFGGNSVVVVVVVVVAAAAAAEVVVVNLFDCRRTAVGVWVSV